MSALHTNDPNLVILAGGISSRMQQSIAQPSIDPELRDAVTGKSKAMIGVGEGNRPFLDYLLLHAAEAGYRDVVLVVGERDDSIRRYYEQDNGARQFPALRISYAIQKIPADRMNPLGTADALLAALGANPGWQGKKFTVCNSDNLYSIRALSSLLADPHRNALIDYDRASLRFAEERIAQFAVLAKDPGGFLADIIEKPAKEEIARAADHTGRIGVSMNIFRFSTDDILPYLEHVPFHPVRDEKELPAAVRLLAREHPQSIFTIPLAEHVIDLTSQADIADVRAYLRDTFPRFSPLEY